MIHALLLGLALQTFGVSGSAEHAMLADLNTVRVRAGLAPLRSDPALDRAARSHVLEMAQHNYFDHRSADGGSPFDRMRQAGARFSWAGENIALDASEPHAFQEFMQSPEHYANMMRPQFDRVGIAVIERPDGQMLFVQDFSD